MHHANMVRNIIAGLQEYFQQDQSQKKNPMVVQAHVDHVENAMQNTQKQLAIQLQRMK